MLNDVANAVKPGVTPPNGRRWLRRLDGQDGGSQVDSGSCGWGGCDQGGVDAVCPDVYCMCNVGSLTNVPRGARCEPWTQGRDAGCNCNKRYSQCTRAALAGNETLGRHHL